MQAPAAVPHTEVIEHMPSEMRLGHEKSISLGILIACFLDNLDRFFVVHSGSGFFAFFVRMPSDS